MRHGFQKNGIFLCALFFIMACHEPLAADLKKKTKPNNLSTPEQTEATEEQKPFDFKGVYLGASEAELKEKFKDFHCSDPDNEKHRALWDRSCWAGTSSQCRPNTWCANDPEKAWNYAGIRAKSVTASFFDDKLHVVILDTEPEDYDSIALAIKAKYGAPRDVKTETIQSRMGATYENQMARWKRGKSTIVIKKYSGSIDASSVVYSLDSSGDIFKERKAKQIKENAKNL